MTANDYWQECLSECASEIGLNLTKEQLQALSEAVEMGHENYGMAFYSPPSSDRFSDLEQEYAKKLKSLQNEFDKYRNNAETAVKQALGQWPDSNVSIGEYGEVTRWGGRITRIQ